MVQNFTVTTPAIKLSQVLGEGCVWDSTTNRLFWLDIERKQVWTYEPSTEICGFEQFDIKLAALALYKTGHGMIASSEKGFNLIPGEILPFPPTYPPGDALKELKAHHVDLIDCGVELSSIEKRVNDGACDNAGRFIAGSMGLQYLSSVGKVYSVSADGKGGFASELVTQGITCTNGIGWTRDGKTMYLTDSWIPEIAAFDYDTATGKMTNRRTFSRLPKEVFGEPDGLCMDAEDGVWSARFMCGKVVRINPQGEVDVIIDFPTAWHMTCCVFGGPDLTDLYVTTADSTRALAPEMGRNDRLDGGSLFVVKGLGFKGVERGRFANV